MKRLIRWFRNLVYEEAPHTHEDDGRFEHLPNSFVDEPHCSVYKGKGIRAMVTGKSAKEPPLSSRNRS